MKRLIDRLENTMNDFNLKKKLHILYIYCMLIPLIITDSVILVSNHQFNWWFIISPPKGYCYCSPQRAVSQALLLARYKAVLLESSRLDSSACSFIYF